MRLRFPAKWTSRPPAVLGTIRGKLHLDEDMSLSYLLHWLRVFGDGRADGPESGAAGKALADLLDTRRLERRFRGPSSLVETPYGARYLTANPAAPKGSEPGRALHAYQALAVFGQIGVPSSRALRISGERHVVGDLLRDCMLNFQARESRDAEVEWAAEALALYLPPERSWRNRWGEEVGFDAIARFLMGRDAARCACQGTHLLAALAAILQAHEAHAILDPRVERQVTARFSSIGRLLRENQRADGSWDIDWAGTAPTPYDPEPWHPVLITGHLAEFQALLPTPCRVPDDCLERALAYLERAVLEADAAEIAEHYCPYSHAGRMVLNWNSTDA
jgi:hypothetical protein